VNPAPFEATAAELDDGVRVVAVRGELDLSTASELEAPLDEAVSPGDASVLIDLSECEFIDSTGIALIVRTWQRLESEADGVGAQVVICSANEQVRRVLEITGIELSIPIHSTREQALAALRPTEPGVA
jgi:anti-anti-sigma factor